MSEEPSKTEILLARMAVALLVGFAVVDLLWYGLSTHELERLWRNIVARPGGPMTFRFVLQPTMATIAAMRDGAADARRNRTPYLSAILFGGERRGARLWEGVISTARILILGLVMDVAYQLVFLDSFIRPRRRYSRSCSRSFPMRCCEGRRRASRDVGSRDAVRRLKTSRPKASDRSQKRIEKRDRLSCRRPERRLRAAKRRSPVRAQCEPARAGVRLRPAISSRAAYPRGMPVRNEQGRAFAHAYFVHAAPRAVLMSSIVAFSTSLT